MTEYQRAYQKIYLNIHAIQLKLKQRINCNCGGRYTYENKSQHIKSAKHKKYELKISIE